MPTGSGYWDGWKAVRRDDPPPPVPRSRAMRPRSTRSAMAIFVSLVFQAGYPGRAFQAGYPGRADSSGDALAGLGAPVAAAPVVAAFQEDGSGMGCSWIRAVAFHPG